jgi:uncharacterized integral membrane protein
VPGKAPGMTRPSMFRKILTAVILVPLAAIIVAFAVANRQTVTVSFDPTSATSPIYAIHLPLFIVLFIVLILGVIVGGIAAWLNQSGWRRAARKLEADLHALHDDIEALRRREPAPERQSLPVIPPPGP